ncbi:C2 and GRAM domain-containing protein At1g03370-like [Nymphaea colorata]|nr:C2 and GRAM domain-containing protein At1g03370-like [Nymphaea colorata]
MKLYVNVLEARKLKHEKLGANPIDAYVKLRTRKHRSKTGVIRGKTNPVWNEELVLRIDDLKEELQVILVVRSSGARESEALGQAVVPVWMVAEAENQTLPTTWFPLQPLSTSTQTHICGNDLQWEILIAISLYSRSNSDSTLSSSPVPSDADSREVVCFESPGRSPYENTDSVSEEASSGAEEKKPIKRFTGKLVRRILNKNKEVKSNSAGTAILQSDESSDNGSVSEEPLANFNFEKALQTMQETNQENGMPDNLQGGILLDKQYLTSCENLNALLFAPNSQLMKELTELQGTTNLDEGAWRLEFGENVCLKRTVTFTKAATKLVRAVKVTEVQTYLCAGENSYAVLKRVSAPDVPYGNCFDVSLLYKIFPGEPLHSGKESSHLVISYNINILRSTVLKGMIEGGVRQGLRENYDQFAELLARKVEGIASESPLSEKKQILASISEKKQSNWKQALSYFLNFTVVSALSVGLYIAFHIFLSVHCGRHGLEFYGLDLPDSVGEVITTALLILQSLRVYNMISHFMHAKLQKGSHFGKEVHNDGWLLTVALIEGSGIASASGTRFSDPYVTFTCNSKNLRSSVQLQSRDPQWNEVVEFDTPEEPPSLLDMEVFDFAGPCEQALSLGHAEINLLKHTPSDLEDLWIPLQGKLARFSQSKLHLRIFLETTKAAQSTRKYLRKVENELGRKVHLQPPHRSSTFQKLFKLPPEEFLVSDFSCCLKRKMLLQGRVFASARVIGFYANIFGHKSKFIFIWEEIYDIQVTPPSLASVGSPSLVFILHEGRGLDAMRYSKSQDEEGRLKFHFQPFGSFSDASRTVMVLWKAKTLGAKQPRR